MSIVRFCQHHQRCQSVEDRSDVPLADRDFC
jgi:hypothetical protein